MHGEMLSYVWRDSIICVEGDLSSMWRGSVICVEGDIICVEGIDHACGEIQPYMWRSIICAEGFYHMYGGVLLYVWSGSIVSLACLMIMSNGCRYGWTGSGLNQDHGLYCDDILSDANHWLNDAGQHYTTTTSLTPVSFSVPVSSSCPDRK